MTKKRSRSQEIGELGEKLFPVFAARRGLLATKMDPDYGVDFLCQRVTPSRAGASGSALPEFVGANVKSSAQDPPTATLTREDLEFALRAQFPLLFMLIDTKHEVHYFRFLDIALQAEIHANLTEAKGYSLNPERMINDSERPDEFEKELAAVSRPDYQNRLRLRAAELNVSSLIGPSRLRIDQRTDGSILIAEFDRIEDVFSQDSPAFQEVRTQILHGPRATSPERLPIEGIPPEVLQTMSGLASELVLSTPVRGGDEWPVAVVEGEQVRAECLFERRQFHDEVSFWHATGLSVSFSAARGEDADRTHATEVGWSEEGTPLFESPEATQFLIECRDGVAIRFGDEPAIPIEYWPSLAQLGRAIRRLHAIYSMLRIPPTRFRLTDLDRPEFRDVYTLLDHALLQSREERGGDPLPGFLMVEDSPDILRKPAELTVPLVFELPEGKVLLRLLASGQVAVLQEEAVGARFNEILVASAEIDDDLPATGVPLMFVSFAAAIAIHPEGTEVKIQESEFRLSAQVLDKEDPEESAG